MSEFVMVAIEFDGHYATRFDSWRNAYGGIAHLADAFGIYYGKDPRYCSYEEIVEAVNYQLVCDEKAPEALHVMWKLMQANAYVELKDYDRFLSDLHSFFNEMGPADEKYVNHWPQIVTAITIARSQQVPAIGFWSSNNDDIWGIHDHELELADRSKYLNVYGSEE
jgi:hypothetical protein